MTGSAQLVEKLNLVDDLMKQTQKESVTNKTLPKVESISKAKHLDFKKKKTKEKIIKGSAKKKIEKKKTKTNLVSASLEFGGSMALKGSKTIPSKKKKKNIQSTKTIFLNSKGYSFLFLYFESN